MEVTEKMKNRVRQLVFEFNSEVENLKLRLPKYDRHFIG